MLLASSHTQLLLFQFVSSQLVEIGPGIPVTFGASVERSLQIPAEFRERLFTMRSLESLVTISRILFIYALLTACRFRFREYRGQVAENGIAHRLLQARTGVRRGDGQLVEDSAEDHKGYLPMMGRFGARESG